MLKTTKKPLSPEQIETLASRKGVRRIAVENFLGSLPSDTTYEEDMANMSLDADLYRWNQATQDALKKGINIAHGLSTLKV